MSISIASGIDLSFVGLVLEGVASKAPLTQLQRPVENTTVIADLRTVQKLSFVGSAALWPPLFATHKIPFPKPSGC